LATLRPPNPITDPHPQRQGDHQALRPRQRPRPRLPGHRMGCRVRSRLEPHRPRNGRRIPLAQARRSVLHGTGLRLLGSGRQGRAQAHLVPLTSITCCHAGKLLQIVGDVETRTNARCCRGSFISTTQLLWPRRIARIRMGNGNGSMRGNVGKISKATLAHSLVYLWISLLREAAFREARLGPVARASQLHLVPLPHPSARPAFPRVPAQGLGREHPAGLDG
jgi:hypothetical protein